MKRTRKSDAGEKVGVIKQKKHLLFFIKSNVFNTLNPQKEVKASPQVNGKDAVLSQRKCLIL